MPFLLNFNRKNEPALGLDLDAAWGGKWEILPADALWHTAEEHNRNLIETVWVPGAHRERPAGRQKQDWIGYFRRGAPPSGPDQPGF